MVIARTRLGLNGGTHVTGTPGANSYARIVRDGTTLYSFG
jgi:hypothetical protein